MRLSILDTRSTVDLDQAFRARSPLDDPQAAVHPQSVSVKAAPTRRW
jgi:hypothetical protein